MFVRKLIALVALVGALSFVNVLDAQIVAFDLEGQAGFGLLPGNEVGSPTSTGSGGELAGILFDVGTSTLSIDVGWGSGNGFTDLTGNATAMHIHGVADFTTNAGVKYGLNGLGGFDGSATSGGLSDSVVIASGDVADLMNGLFYINVHTAANGGGELRGNLVQAVPEPTSLAVLGLFGVTLIARRRRR